MDQVNEGQTLESGKRWFIATARGYDGMQIIEPGQKFLYAGKPGQWCHPVDEEPVKKINFDALMNTVTSKPQETAKPDAAVVDLATELMSAVRETAALKDALAKSEARADALSTEVTTCNAALQRAGDELKKLEAELEAVKKGRK